MCIVSPADTAQGARGLADIGRKFGHVAGASARLGRIFPCVSIGKRTAVAVGIKAEPRSDLKEALCGRLGAVATESGSRSIEGVLNQGVSCHHSAGIVSRNDGLV